MRITHYFDYKSPYAYLAQEATFALAEEAGSRGVDFAVKPYTLDIPSFLGAAELDEDGADTVGTRTGHQWRRVRYTYMDCRREATRRGLVLRGPRKIFDSSIAHIGFYFACGQGDVRRYHDATFERFWRREFDIEDVAAVETLLRETGYDTAGFRAYLTGEGRALHDAECRRAEAAGVFGVPSYLVDDRELFWGGERIADVRRLLGTG